MGYLDSEYRHIMRNLLWPERIEKLDVEKWVAYCRNVGAKAVCIDIKSQAYALYNSEYIEKDPILDGRDLASEVADAATKLNMKWCAYIAPSELESLVSSRPEWLQKLEDGSITNRESGACFCWNSPYLELFCNILKEIAEKYNPQGFYIDGLRFSHSPQKLTCYCSYCRGRFEKEYGLPLPDSGDCTSKSWLPFIRARKKWLAETSAAINNTIHTVDQDITTILNNKFGGGGWALSMSLPLAEHFDLFSREMISNPMRETLPYGFSFADNILWHSTAQRAIKKDKPCFIYNSLRPTVRKEDMALSTDLFVASGNALCVQEWRHDISDIMKRIEKAEPLLNNLTSVNNIAIHYSESSLLMHYKPWEKLAPGNNASAEDEFSNEAKGLFKACLDNYQAADLILDEDLISGEFEKYKLLILPNSTVLLESVKEKLLEYVKEGGTILASMSLGTIDENGDNSTDRLIADNVGLKSAGFIKTRKPWLMSHESGKLEIENQINPDPAQYLVFEKGNTADWLGEEVSPTNHPEPTEERENMRLRDKDSVLLSAAALKIDADESWDVEAVLRFCDDESGEWLETPAVLTRNFGKGKIVYSSFQMGSLFKLTPTSKDIGYSWWRSLLGHIIELAIGQPEICIKAPACVKAVYRQQKEVTILHLVNELSSLPASLHVEERIPVPLSVSLPADKVSDVDIKLGAEYCKVEKRENNWFIECSALKDRIAITFKKSNMSQ
ncbi:MAG: beta-galactosidase trimerization domain-containing protein [Planctomycetota bacterium]|jgi:hypothetical protein